MNICVAKIFPPWHLLIVLGLALLVACGSTQPPSPTTQGADPVSVLQAFDTALKAKDLDAAMALVADDAVFDVGGPAAGVYTGKEQIRRWLQSEMARNVTVERSHFQVTSDKVTYSWKIFSNGVLRDEGTGETIVQDGRIRIY